MSSKAMSLKARIRNYAKDNRIAAQVVLQNYMFECFLARLSRSEYRDKFVIKGGMREKRADQIHLHRFIESCKIIAEEKNISVFIEEVTACFHTRSKKSLQGLLR